MACHPLREAGSRAGRCSALRRALGRPLALRRRDAQTIIAQAPFPEAASGYLAKAAICASLREHVMERARVPASLFFRHGR
ncbi:hypothetical protein BUPH_08552 [Paraburkholderia phenoliruptrix BR3459a]|uniref:Uncharacterized protein n=1 Tax=Paraburkholderia phenoliruptrix BR3459a TaxID=1229205 RepID=K0E1D0_9BURK|nr:hypothetical protein BUPH_08552 [Paraburkholderia phenoliruptrix BR3459a]